MSFKHTHLINEQHNTKKWKRFYLLEQEFYSFLDQNGTILKSEVNCLPQYKTIATAGGKFVQAPPIYVRAVISIANSIVKDAVKYSERS
ncbi:hypothetical protein [Photobacterium leiognathi]|uniref:hypothetical protein n=1 Tax=Photobacterium leiognathi TaxID=553611 RepID=UPI0027393430|nr:hypothetical protein [Photobacterium leiognathi]